MNTTIPASDIEKNVSPKRDHSERRARLDKLMANAVADVITARNNLIARRVL